MFVLEKIREYANSGRTALVNREEQLSYGELDRRSDAFAGWLLDRFGRDKAPVVIYGHKETNFLPCVFGALKAGRGYVPVDISTPPDRAAEIAADIHSCAAVNFTAESLETDAFVLQGPALDRLLSSPPVARVPDEAWLSGEDTAYVLFTSGSTGKPKGVPITVNNLANFYQGLLPHMPEKEGGVILNQISYSFDVSGCSLYAGLSRGMTLFTVDKGMVEDMGAMFRYLGQSGLTLWVSTPSFAELCCRSGAFSSKLLPGIGSFLFCGEVLTHKLCDSLAERFPQSQVVNTYGPTEATVLVTAVEITQAMRDSEQPIPIGRPLEEVELRLINWDGEEILADNERGELHIISGSVGPGYHNRPEQTARAFFLDAISGKRGYRTGDLCYRRDGQYYYCGRVDNQLKLNGYRVELEDVENNLVKLDNISRAAVLPVWADEEHSRVQYLAAFLLLERDDGLTPLKRTVELKRQASATLPSYMVPRKMIVVDAFPLNTNGKIDKKALAKQLLEAVKQ